MRLEACGSCDSPYRDAAGRPRTFTRRRTKTARPSPRACTARFVDRAGGLGVLSGDMTVVRFEVRNGAVTAIGRIVGALADSRGRRARTG